MKVENGTKNVNRRVQVKRKQNKTVYASLGGGILGAMILFFVFLGYPVYEHNQEMVSFYTDHFLVGTKVNGVDISDRTPEEAETYLEDVLSDYRLDILTREGTCLTVTGDDIAMEADVKADLDNLLTLQNPKRWSKGAGTPMTAKVTYSFDRDKLESWFSTEPYFSLEDRPANKAAYVEFEDGSYTYHAQIQGTRIVPDSMYAALQKAVLEREPELDLNETAGYVDPLMPDVPKKDIQKITDNLAEINRHLQASITYDLGDGMKETVGSDLLSRVYYLDENHEIVFDQKPLEEFLTEKAGLYNTAYHHRDFLTHDGTYRTLEPGTYGWKIDYEASLAALIAMVQAAETRTDADFIYTQTAVSHVPDHDFGDTYIEVDIDEQHVYVWRDGQCVYDMACVTGDATKPDYYTWEGVWYVAYMERNHIMRGTRDENGIPEYEIPCEYWMNFIPSVGIGLHDLHRIYWGADAYIRNGSHGCVNLPLGDAAVLYREFCYVGIPVITYGGLKNIG